jgi:23S rRNA G2445 N2-methylase RlmL
VTPQGKERAGGQSRPPGFFATTLPGLGGLLKAEIAAHPGLEPDEEVGFDGRADIVFFRQHRGANFGLSELRLAEDLFAEIGQARAGSVQRVATEVITRSGLERALSIWTRFARPLGKSMTFRAIARVVDESRFKRTELRDTVLALTAGNRPRWRIADPAQLEIWVLEHQRGRFASGLRLSDKSMRQHGTGRPAERHGALRPVVAAAMVSLAGEPPGKLLDPCCGTGTIVAEALAAGWDGCGSDVDPHAVTTARTNEPDASFEQADVLDLPHPDSSVDAVVSNLPFGQQFRVDTDRQQWLTQALRETARVTHPGGRVVVLVPPPIPRDPPGLKLAETHSIVLLGVRTRIWVYDRDQNPPAVPNATAAAQR